MKSEKNEKRKPKRIYKTKRKKNMIKISMDRERKEARRQERREK